YGAAVFATVFLMPALGEAGADTGVVMAGLERRRLMIAMPSFGGLTVLTGVWLYWHFTSGFNPGISTSAGGLGFGVGGAFGLAALIVGGSVVGRSVRRMTVSENRRPPCL